MKDPFEDVPLQARQAVLGSGIAIGALVLLSLMYPTTMGTVGVLAFFLIVVIGLHELGHFYFAKRAGMKVTEFFIGFGPRLWSVQRGETEYGVKALPLGGYCKIVGMTNLEEVDPADEDRTFRSKGLWAKVSTLLAGPASHFVLAAIMMWAVIGFHGDTSTAQPTTTLYKIEADSAAAKARLQPGDAVLAFAGEEIKTYEELTSLIQANGNKNVPVIVRRGGQLLTLAITPGERVIDGKKQGFLGITPDVSFDKPGVLKAAALTPTRLWSVTTQTVSGFGHVFSPSGFGDYLSNFTDDSPKDAAAKVEADQKKAESRFISLYGVGRVANDAVESGWMNVLGLLIMINISVGLINLLPLIPFDGGHIAVAFYESIMSKVYGRKYRADFAKILPVAVATLSFFAFIFLSSLFLDITNPPENPF